LLLKFLFEATSHIPLSNPFELLDLYHVTYKAIPQKKRASCKFPDVMEQDITTTLRNEYRNVFPRLTKKGWISTLGLCEETVVDCYELW